MRYLFLCGGLLMLAACTQPSPPPTAARPVRPGTALFPIVVAGRWGFIDSTGAVVIAPRFAQVQNFSEGLAPVREAGRYGYLDKTGRLVLPPRYAYAAPFQNKVALVYTDSTLQLIDQAGRQLPLPAAYKRLDWIGEAGQRGLWEGTRPDFKSQLLTAQGRLLNPTWFKEVGRLSNNRLVVTITAPATDPNGPAETELVGALDGRGRLVIPYRRFDRISTFREGLATATLYQPIYNEKARQECIIDTSGRVLALLPKGKYVIDDDGFSNGVMQANLITRMIDELNSESYPVVLDRTGKPLFRNPRLRLLGKYGHNRTWTRIAGHDGEWCLLDKTGRQLNKVAVESVLSLTGPTEAPTFTDGVELVQLSNGSIAALDTLGRVVRQLPNADDSFQNPEQRGSLVAFYADTTHLMGFWNWRTGLVVKPRFSAVSYAGYQHGLLAVVEDNRLGYLSPAGRYVWREAPKTSRPLNVDYMSRTSYHVASVPLRRYAGVGGWGRSDNPARLGQPPVAGAPALQVAVAPKPEANALATGVSGHRVTITNTSPDTVVFDAQDSRLYMNLQAQDARGRWRDIEYVPSSWCGNSYHQVFLAPGQYWQLTVPAYSGAQPTQLRVRLLRRKSAASRQPEAVYSNSFAGGVNPAQFWRQEGYVPQSIMDPYNN